MGNSTSSPPPLLFGVDPGVENKILLFASSGEGGLQNILNLRLVCSTTKLWVDRLPKKDADIIFSKAQIVVDWHLQSLRRFVSSPPPFKVTTLSIVRKSDALELSDVDSTWTRFCAYWRPNLEILIVSNNLLYYGTSTTSRRHILELMESPNLFEVRVHGFFVLPEGSNVPSRFANITKFHADFVLPEDPKKWDLMSQFRTNSNFRELSVRVQDSDDFAVFSSLIKQRKEDTQLQLNFNLDSQILEIYLYPENETEEIYRQFLQGFVKSIVDSHSKIRLKIHSLGGFYKLMNVLLPPTDTIVLFKTIESAETWSPTTETLSLLSELYPRLKKLMSVDTEDSSVEFDQIEFPPLLEELEFTKGFAPLAHLPPTLTALRLNKCTFDMIRVGSLLNLIRRRCPSLTSLTIRNWQSVTEDEEAPDANFERSPPFRNLRILSFGGKLLNKNDEQEIRRALANEFDWANLKLSSLFLRFKDFQGQVLRLVGENILRGLVDGPSTKTLRLLRVPNEAVTLEAIPLLMTLKSLPFVKLKKL